MDHTGLTILPDFYYEPSATATTPNSSGSTLKWPNQQCPGKRAWRAWRNLLTRLYLKSNTTNLTQRLGPWIPESMNSDWKWQWKMCPNTQRLYQRRGDLWSVYLPYKTGRTLLQYSDPVDHHSIPPMKAVPVTVAIPQPRRILVKMPVTLISKIAPPPPAPRQHLLHQLIYPTETWEEPLWKNVQPHQDLFRLAQDLTSGIPIILSTDAAMNAAKRSCFAWTIYSTTELWQGSGVVPGPYEDAHSTRSEAFGILTMLRFLAQYISKFPLTLNHVHPIALYCDNKGILQRLTPKKY